MPADDDMQIPTRDEAQIAQDAARTAEQVQQLGTPPNAQVVDVLKTRHDQTPGALRFDTVGRQNGGNALVVARQLVVPRGDRIDEVHDELTGNRGFVRVPALEDDAVRIYAYEGDGDDDAARDVVDEAHGSLTNMGVAAARTMVTALHMVVKSEGGPAPTTVTVPPFPAAGAPTDNQIVVAVIDTGIDGDSRADGWLNEVARNNNLDALDALPQNGKLDFGAGHGTFVTGVIRQVDPHAKIVVYRALDSDGLASEDAVAAAMLQAAADGAHVINLSLGMQAVDDSHACPALQHAVGQIHGGPHAPAIVASAGNYGTEDRVYPAALHGVVSVAALQGVEHPDAGPPPEGAEWSSRGDWVTCSAVGEGIVSTFVEGQEDPALGGTDTYPSDSWAVWSGTSFAAPQIAALISKKCREENLTPQQAVDALFPPGQGPGDGYGSRVVVLPGTKPSP